jgi:pimeloyl-ACP methyl ester carboxylesterase
MTAAYATSKIQSNHPRMISVHWLLVFLLLVCSRTESFSPLSTACGRTAGAKNIRTQELFYKNGLPEQVDQTTKLDTTQKEEDDGSLVSIELPRVRRIYETFQWHHPTNQGEETAYNINYRVEGPVDGPPILLIHGFGANVGHFRHQFPALTEAGYRVYAIDMLGFGASDKPGNVEYSIELFTELLNDFVLAMDDETSSRNSASSTSSSLPKKKWVVAGNSIGGLCSLNVAEKLPDLIRGVVLFNASGGMSVFRDEYVLPIFRPILHFFQNVLLGPRLGKYFFSNFKTRENVESVLKSQGVYRNASRVDEELLEILLEPGNDEGAETVFLKVFGGPPGPTPESILPKLDCPVLAIWGGADPWLPVDGGMHPGTKFHRYMKDEGDFELVILPNVGHCPHDEASDEVNACMIPWIESLPLWVGEKKGNTKRA